MRNTSATIPLGDVLTFIGKVTGIVHLVESHPNQLSFFQLCSKLWFPSTEQPSFNHSSARSPRRRLQNVQKEPNYGIPLPDHHLLCPQLPGRLQQQGSGAQVREQRDEHPTGNESLPLIGQFSPYTHSHWSVQLQPPPLLVAQLHGRVYLVTTLRRWKR